MNDYRGKGEYKNVLIFDYILMRKSLQELQLVTPVINLLDTRLMN